MFPSALMIPAPIPLVLDLTLEFGPVLLLVVLALLGIGAVGALHAAIVAHRGRSATAGRPTETSLLAARRQGSNRQVSRARRAA